MSVWSVWGDEVWYSGWRAENYLSCITALVGPQDLEVKRLFNVQFFSCWSIGGFWTWRSLSLLSRSAFHIPNSLGILLPYRSSGSDWPWRLWMIPNPRFSPTLKGLGVCSYPSLTHTHTPIHQFRLSHHPHHISLSYNLSFAPPWPLAGSLII